MGRSEHQEVLRATVRLIEATRAYVPTYGAGFGGVSWGGSSTDEVSQLLKRCRTRVRERRLPDGVTGMAVPNAVSEGHTIVLDPRAERADRIFTLRHELAHILAGEVAQALFLTSEDTMSFSERRADLFAITDLTPTSWVKWIRGGRRPWQYVTLEVKQAFRELTEAWSEQRLNDRAKLRVLLFRDYGI